MTPAIDWDSDRKGDLVRQLVNELGNRFYTSLNIISSQLKASSFFLQLLLYLPPLLRSYILHNSHIFLREKFENFSSRTDITFFVLMIEQHIEILFSSG